MDGHARGGGELLVADMALEVLGLLVLNKNLLVLELPLAVVAKHLRCSLLLLLYKDFLILLITRTNMTTCGFLYLLLSWASHEW